MANASHIKDISLVEMTHLNETIFAAGIASSYRAHKTSAGNWQNDDMLANVCKHNVTRFPYEIGRLAQDIAGGLVVTMPSEKEFRNPEMSRPFEKYLKGPKRRVNREQDEGIEAHRKYDSRTKCSRLSDRVNAWRRIASSAENPDCARCSLKPRKKLAKRLAMVKEGELQKWCQSLQNTLIEYLT